MRRRDEFEEETKLSVIGHWYADLTEEDVEEFTFEQLKKLNAVLETFNLKLIKGDIKQLHEKLQQKSLKNMNEFTNEYTYLKDYLEGFEDNSYKKRVYTKYQNTNDGSSDQLSSLGVGDISAFGDIVHGVEGIKLVDQNIVEGETVGKKDGLEEVKLVDEKDTISKEYESGLVSSFEGQQSGTIERVEEERKRVLDDSIESFSGGEDEEQDDDQQYEDKLNKVESQSKAKFDDNKEGEQKLEKQSINLASSQRNQHLSEMKTQHDEQAMVKVQDEETKKRQQPKPKPRQQAELNSESSFEQYDGDENFLQDDYDVVSDKKVEQIKPEQVVVQQQEREQVEKVVQQSPLNQQQFNQEGQEKKQQPHGQWSQLLQNVDFNQSYVEFSVQQSQSVQDASKIYSEPESFVQETQSFYQQGQCFNPYQQQAYQQSYQQYSYQNMSYPPQMNYQQQQSYPYQYYQYPNMYQQQGYYQQMPPQQPMFPGQMGQQFQNPMHPPQMGHFPGHHGPHRMHPQGYINWREIKQKRKMQKHMRRMEQHERHHDKHMKHKRSKSRKHSKQRKRQKEHKRRQEHRYDSNQNISSNSIPPVDNSYVKPESDDSDVDFDELKYRKTNQNNAQKPKQSDSSYRRSQRSHSRSSSRGKEYNYDRRRNNEKEQTGESFRKGEYFYKKDKRDERYYR